MAQEGKMVSHGLAKAGAERIAKTEARISELAAKWQANEEERYNRVGWLSWLKEIKFEDLPLWKQIEARRLGWR